MLRRSGSEVLVKCYGMTYAGAAFRKAARRSISYVICVKLQNGVMEKPGEEEKKEVGEEEEEEEEEDGRGEGEGEEEGEEEIGRASCRERV